VKSFQEVSPPWSQSGSQTQALEGGKPFAERPGALLHSVLDHFRPMTDRAQVRVDLERHPEGVEALPGYVWLDMPGKVRSAGAHELE